MSAFVRPFLKNFVSLTALEWLEDPASRPSQGSVQSDA